MDLLVTRWISCLVLLLGAISARAEPDISAPQAFERTKQGSLLIIDIRTPEEWRETGVIPGARRVDFYKGPQVLLKSVLEMVGGDKNAPFAVVCHSGSRSNQAQKFLRSITSSPRTNWRDFPPCNWSTSFRTSWSCREPSRRT